jgi:hypothetical protein
LPSAQVPEDKRAELYEGHQAYLADKAARDAEKEKRREAEKLEKAERAAKRKKDDDASDDEASERHKVPGGLLLVLTNTLHLVPGCSMPLGLCPASVRREKGSHLFLLGPGCTRILMGGLLIVTVQLLSAGAQAAQEVEAP